MTAPKSTPAKKQKAASSAPAPRADAPKLASKAQRYSWRKLSAAKWADAWLERLAFLGPQRAMAIEFPGARSVRIEAHGITKTEADGLLKMFGGKVSESKWLTMPEEKPRPPIRIRKQLLVVSTAEELAANAETERGPAVILIPAGMAFGTGEHDTTATCLRFIADVSREREGQSWEALDLGAGTAILAIAARKLGAARVDAADFDPHAVRTAKENIRVNGLSRVVMRKLDVRDWEPLRTWDVVISNLFSTLLVETAPKIASAVAPDGRLIFSGVLREQEAEVLASFRRAGIVIDRIVRKGKWVSGLGGRK